MAYKESELILNKKITINNYLISENDFSVVCDAENNNITIILPDPSDVKNQIFDVCFLHLNHQVKIIPLNGNINGANEFVFNDNPYSSIAVQAIEGNYFIVDVHYIKELLGACHYDSICEIATEYFCSEHCGTWDGPDTFCATMLGCCLYDIAPGIQSGIQTTYDFCSKTGGTWQGSETDCPYDVLDIGYIEEDTF